MGLGLRLGLGLGLGLLHELVNQHAHIRDIGNGVHRPLPLPLGLGLGLHISNQEIEGS